MCKSYYVTTYCNHAHRLSDGKPVAHACYVLPPKALQLERQGHIDDAIQELERAKPFPVHWGVKSRCS